MDKKEDKKGIGGFLILVAFSVVISPIRLIISVIPVYFPILSDGTWQILTTPGTEYFHPLWGPLLIFEIIFNLAQILVLFYIAYLFFSKDHLFPKFYIGITLITIVFIPLDAWLVKIILPDLPMFDDATLGNFIAAVLSGLIWIPVMLLSKRVKETFVNNQPVREQIEIQEFSL
ncbi:MAG: DUF2569 domain-containing protein [Anaerolineales bacterium]|nr:DUF2569 domain-containing protein [Anaerolineales bacterium]